MLKQKLLIITALILMMTTLSAQEIRDGNNDPIATIDSVGIIKDLNNDQIGQFMTNGEIHDMNGDVVGEIDGNHFKDMNNAIIGSLNSSDEVFDGGNMKLGTLDNGITFNDLSEQAIISSDSTIDNKWLVAYYFFFLNNM